MTSKQDETGEIVLAGGKHKIETLTLDQLQEVMPALDRMRGSQDIAVLMKELRLVVAVTTGKTDAELGKMKISLEELLAAVAAICKLAGLEELGKTDGRGTDGLSGPSTDSGGFDWFALYAQTCADTGWTWDQVGRLTLPRHRALYRHFRRQPPAAWLLAAFVGYRPPSEEAPRDAIDVRALLDRVPGEEGKPKVITLDMLAALL